MKTSAQIKLIALGAVIAAAIAFVKAPSHLFLPILGGIVLVAIGLMYNARPKKGYEKTKANLKKLKGKSKTDSYGSADFAEEKDITDMGLWGKTEPNATYKGLIIGKFKGKFLRFAQPGHLITFAPTRSGKGVGQVIPNCLDHPGSIVVNDIKGENYSISHEYRRKFTDVYCFAPFGKEQGIESSSYNPIDFIRVGTENEMDDVALIGDMIILEEGKDPFWEREARNLVIALILHVATSRQPALRNMGEVQFLISQSKRDMEATFKEMVESKNANVRKMGNAFSATEAKVLSSIMSVAKSQMAIWNSPLLKAITGKSNFDPADIKRRPISFYLIIPPDQLDPYKPVVRLMVGILIASMVRTSGKPKIPVLYLIDEFAALGYMKNIETGIGYLAGYGIHLWMFLQDMTQMKRNYEKGWESFLANCSIRTAFGTNDPETAKTISEMLGKTTIMTESGGKSKDAGKLLGGSKSKNTSETSRELMTPDEVMKTPYDTQLIFVQSGKPILSEKIFYFSDPYFKGKFGEWKG